MKLIVWDRGWSGAEIIISSEPDRIIEFWRKEYHDQALKGMKLHDPEKFSFNPWIRDVQDSSNTESFLRTNNIKVYDIVDGLRVETDGDS